MSHHARRKIYSSTFRSDWVVPDGQKRSETDSQRLDSLVASASDSDSVSKTHSRASVKSDRNATEEFFKQESSSKTGLSLPKGQLFADDERPRSRYSTFHAKDWTVPGPPNRRMASSTTFEPFDVTSGATDHVDNDERTRRRTPHLSWFRKRSHQQDATNMPNSTKLNGSATRPSSAGSGYDVPPKPPATASTYSPA